MRANIEEYKAVEEAAMKFVKSVAEGNSKYARELFIDEAVLFGYLDGKLEHGSIEQFYHNVDTVGAGDDFNTHRRGGRRRDPRRGARAGREIGRPYRLHRLPAADEDGRRVAVRGEGVQSEFEYHSKVRRKRHEDNSYYGKSTQAWQQLCHDGRIYQGSGDTRPHGATI